MIVKFIYIKEEGIENRFETDTWLDLLLLYSNCIGFIGLVNVTPSPVRSDDLLTTLAVMLLGSGEDVVLKL